MTNGTGGPRPVRHFLVQPAAYQAVLDFLADGRYGDVRPVIQALEAGTRAITDADKPRIVEHPDMAALDEIYHRLVICDQCPICHETAGQHRLDQVDMDLPTCPIGDLKRRRANALLHPIEKLPEED